MIFNRSAARLAMSVFQRRLASSTYALMRSFERRIEKLEGMIDDLRNGRLTEGQLTQRQRQLDRADDLEDAFDSRTADEDAASDSDGEQNEEFEDRALGGTLAVNLAELETERLKSRRTARQGAEPDDRRPGVQVREAPRGAPRPPLLRPEAHRLH